MRITVEVSNLDEARQAIERKLSRMEGNEIVAGVQRAMMVVVADAKKFAPVDTGRLRASITPSIVQQVSPGVIEGVVGSNVEYAPYQEFGTSKMAGRFYFRRAWEATAGRVGKMIAIIIRTIVES